MKIIPLNESGLKKSQLVLQNGGVVVFPSDTVYGLLSDATNRNAVMKLQKIKNRPVGKPISVFVADLKMMKRLVRITEKQERTLRALLPGPYTIVLPSKKKVSRLLESEKETLGVRLPVYQPIIDLVTSFRKPVTATSANMSGRPPFYSITTFLKTLSKKNRELIDLVVDAGELSKNKPSTVLDFSTSQVKTIRQGDLHFNLVQTVFTYSEEETRKFANGLLQDQIKKSGDKPIVFILKGEMGVGKTIFAKGIGSALGVSNIISPTYVIYYEYKINHPIINLFIHCDLFNIEEQNEFKYLGLDFYFNKGNVLCFEWGEKAGELIQELKKKAHLIVISFSHHGNNKRRLQIEINI